MAGSSYTVEVRNQDSIEHNFTFTDGNANQDIEGGEDAKVTSGPRPPAATSSSASTTRRP